MQHDEYTQNCEVMFSKCSLLSGFSMTSCSQHDVRDLGFDQSLSQFPSWCHLQTAKTSFSKLHNYWNNNKIRFESVNICIPVCNPLIAAPGAHSRIYRRIYYCWRVGSHAFSVNMTCRWQCGSEATCWVISKKLQCFIPLMKCLCEWSGLMMLPAKHMQCWFFRAT